MTADRAHESNWPLVKAALVQANEYLGFEALDPLGWSLFDYCNRICPAHFAQLGVNFNGEDDSEADTNDLALPLASSCALPS